MGVIIEFTKKGNIPVTVGQTKAYAMALPVSNMYGTWGIFADDLTWQERIAINQPMAVIAKVSTGGIVTKDNKMLGKVEELGDQWVLDEALKVIMRTIQPKPVGWIDPDEGRLPS